MPPLTAAKHCLEMSHHPVACVHLVWPSNTPPLYPLRRPPASVSALRGCEHRRGVGTWIRQQGNLQQHDTRQSEMLTLFSCYIYIRNVYQAYQRPKDGPQSGHSRASDGPVGLGSTHFRKSLRVKKKDRSHASESPMLFAPIQGWHQGTARDSVYMWV